jgi:hypothetical protein
MRSGRTPFLPRLQHISESNYGVFLKPKKTVLLNRLADSVKKRRRSGAAARLLNKNMQVETAKMRFCDFGNIP